MSKKIFFITLIYSLIFTFFFLSSSPFYIFNNSYDSNIYFNMGRAWMNGILPYKSLFEQKGPLLYFIYGIGSIISSKDFFGVYIIQNIFFFLNLFFAYKTARIYCSIFFSLSIIISYPILLSFSAIGGGSAEEFITLFQTISIFFFIKLMKTGEHIIKTSFILSLLASCTILIKLNLIIFWFPLIIVITLYSYSISWNFFIKNLVYCFIGIITPILPFVIYFYKYDALMDMLNCYIIFNMKYSKGATVPTFFFLEHIFNFIKYHWFYIAFLISGVLYFTFSNKISFLRHCRLGLFFSFLLMFLMILPSVHGYYYVALNPFLILGLIMIYCISPRKKYLIISQSLIFISTIYSSYVILNLNFKKKEDNYRNSIQKIINPIKRDANPTLMSISLFTMPFTYTGVLPSNYYFFYPNISRDNVPVIALNQETIIKEQKVKFIILDGERTNINKVLLLKHYTLIVKSKNPITNDNYFLYKSINANN